ncbi:SIMPL domain-containing protein [Salinimonas lutimaris]|uniref:SIMPL domain-containing protein n=1 Tax=Salinimonas lutimaris TaxID=914153 RepID=UPI0010C0B928|nr:SIMPL domain-containing protein [Salinimonas lutimaris]
MPVRKTIALIATALLMNSLTTPVLAQSTAVAMPVPQIHVSGTGSAVIVPDTFSVTFILEQKGESLTKMNTRMQQDMRQLSDFLLEQGVAERHIQSMQIQLNPWYQSTSQGREEKGFVLSREVTVVHGNLNQYDALIDGALKRGVTRISHFELTAADQDKAYQQALINAVSDAKSRASLLARELGVTVGQVQSLSEGNRGAVRMESRAKMMMADSATGAMPGQQYIKASVSVTFALQ